MIAIVGVISTGCGSNDPAGTGSDATSSLGTSSAATSKAPAETGAATTASTASSLGTGGGANATGRDGAVKFAECMRDNGIKGFPDPDQSGQLTIDAVANGSSVDPNTAAFKQALTECKDLEPPGFTGHKRSAQEQAGALKFAQCVRDNGAKDFPDPTPDEPLVDTNRIPSTDRKGGMSALNAAMQKCSRLAAAAGVVAGK
jgi:hypothetical protein